MTYNFHCDGKDSCSNTKVDEQLCSEEKFVCNKKGEGDVEEYVSKVCSLNNRLKTRKINFQL